jgi:hypothetical protein
MDMSIISVQYLAMPGNPRALAACFLFVPSAYTVHCKPGRFDKQF